MPLFGSSPLGTGVVLKRWICEEGPNQVGSLALKCQVEKQQKKIVRILISYHKLHGQIREVGGYGRGSDKLAFMYKERVGEGRVHWSFN